MDKLSQGETNERMAGAPGSVQIGGETYLASPPTDQDFGTLHNHLRRKLKTPLVAIAEDLKGLPPDVQDRAIRAAVELKAGGGAAMTPEFVAGQLHTPEGCAFVAWLLIRKNHPDLKLETLARAIRDEETAIQVLSDLGQAVGGLEKKAAGPSG